MIQKILARTLIPFIRALLHCFFRQIEVSHLDRVPEDGPLIFTPNHMNSLIDGFLAVAFLPRNPRPLAKATLWNNPLVKPLLVSVKAIPVHRQQDVFRSADSDSSSSVDNTSMFKTCYKVLVEHSSILLFPEGKSHDRPEIQPLKTGTARIALAAEAKHKGLGCRIVPVGITFDAKHKFRSKVLINIGEPIDPLIGLPINDFEDSKNVAQLTHNITEGIKSVTLNYPSWEEGNYLKRAAQLCVSPPGTGVGKSKLADIFPLHKQLADIYPVFKQAKPLKAERLLKAVKSYDRLLKVLSIEHDHIIKEHPSLLNIIYNLRKLSLFFVRLPLSLLGLLLNIVPFYLIRIIGYVQPRSDRKSTTKLIVSVFLFPILWTLESMLLGKVAFSNSIWWFLAPISGVASIMFIERHNQIWEELSAYLKHPSKAEIQDELQERLEKVKMEVEELLAVAREQESN